MEFKAQVRLLDTPEVKKQHKDDQHIKDLLLEAFSLLTKKDAESVAEAEEFLKGVNH